MQDLTKFEDAANTSKGLPPVHLWKPDYLGDLDMRIAADGSWYYQGTPIIRDRMVRLFSTILRKDEDERTYLVTPHEKYGIRVEDAPFTVVAMEAQGGGPNQTLMVTTNVGDACRISSDHPFRFAQTDEAGMIKPYVRIRGRLDALMNRAIFYDLIELGAVENRNGEDWFGVWSGGEFWPMAHADEIGAES